MGKNSNVSHDSDMINFPEDIVRDRFKHLSGPLELDVRFAEPYPKEIELNAEAGLLFCFLPTRVASGFPFHIHIDGQTTSNRGEYRRFNTIKMESPPDGTPARGYHTAISEIAGR